ncbi:hypothetical protein [Vibrio sp. Y20_XG_PY13]|uniref:hypothetical protein n=1 Tax=Vibrio sp. Y20_XG_PY13 TaxID=2957761 RepID=UPI0020A3E367|nr:hypothetical protein [Vibrio sp. Y20_XG_PY13]
MADEKMKIEANHNNHVLIAEIQKIENDERGDHRIAFQINKNWGDQYFEQEDVDEAGSTEALLRNTAKELALEFIPDSENIKFKETDKRANVVSIFS